MHRCLQQRVQRSVFFKTLLASFPYLPSVMCFLLYVLIERERARHYSMCTFPPIYPYFLYCQDRKEVGGS